MESVARSIGPLGARRQRHRMLFHHIPLAIASVGLVVLFTTLPRFDVSAYDHVDLMTGAFPQPRASAAETKRDASTHGQQTARGTNHGNEHATATEHRHDVRTGESRPVAHGEARTRASDHGRDVTQPPGQQRVSLSRIVQQLTVATGYVGIGLLAITLLIGPVNLVLGKRNPVSTYLRRDLGIWAAILSVVHVALAVAIHVSHGSGVVTAVVHFFIAEDGRPLTNSFGWGNWTGLTALVIVLGLLATSSDAALRMLKARPWKWLQRLTYALFVLVVLHADFYGALLRMASPFTRLLLLSIAMVLVGQLAGVWLWRRRHVSRASLA